ncbi:hypothetical protein V6N12_027051 [Hibiscus sabdariffa]|uniref:Uncharacterized protein n=1 Tax=Hibiscus sabdariffa TaxID=183260 RepID=A0ABR2DV43_9ROSI
MVFWLRGEEDIWEKIPFCLEKKRKFPNCLCPEVKGGWDDEWRHTLLQQQPDVAKFFSDMMISNCVLSHHPTAFCFLHAAWYAESHPSICSPISKKTLSSNEESDANGSGGLLKGTRIIVPNQEPQNQSQGGCCGSSSSF